MASASSVSSPTTSARRCTARVPESRPSCPRRANASKACCRLSLPRRLSPEERDEARQLQKLHAAVGAEILDHQYALLARLPTKRDGFAWTLGPAGARLGARQGADYALFTYLRDSYTSRSRALLMLAAAAFTIPMLGGSQAGFMSLVDLKTGDIVWFNKIDRLTGHLRSREAAEETAKTLLSGLSP
jgi:hypothetical protein